MKTKSDVSTVGEVMKYFRILMALLYIAIGVAVMFGPIERFNISTKYAFPLGSLMIAYGLFRSYKVFKK
jgi:hypothetical protein